MATVNDCRWGSYSQFEGPAYYGGKPVVLKRDANFVEKVVAIVASTEGKFASINMYDSCIISVGIMQYCERASGKVTDMIGAVADALGVEYVNQKLAPALAISKAVFKKNAAGNWRFFLLRDGKEIEVNTTISQNQQQLFLGCDGKKGSWTTDSRLQARTWCAAVASLWESEEACAVQYKFCSDRILKSYVTPTAKSALFSDANGSEDGWPGALKAICVSYAVNRPADAEKMLVLGMQRSKFPKWSRGWCLDIIRTFAVDSGIGLWPIRYNSIRKTVEQAFNITMPPTVRELTARGWITENSAAEVSTNGNPPSESESDVSIPVTLEEVTVEGEMPVTPEPQVEKSPSIHVENRSSIDFHPIMFIVSAVGAGFVALAKFIEYIFHIHR